jgi:ribosomal protein S18 acetylase RimI-like enzyme
MSDTVAALIRPYGNADKADVINLWHESGLVRPWNDPERDIRGKRDVQPDLFLVAEFDGRVVGTVMAGYDGHRGWLYLLAVSPDCRRRAIGTRLVREAVDRLRHMGCWKVNLQIRDTNLGVRSFYEHLGFKDDHVIGMGLRLAEAEAEGAA